MHTDPITCVHLPTHSGQNRNEFALATLNVGMVGVIRTEVYTSVTATTAVTVHGVKTVAVNLAATMVGVEYFPAKRDVFVMNTTAASFVTNTILQKVNAFSCS